MEKQGGTVPLTAEQVREAASRLLEGINGSDPKELAREVFRDGGDFTAAVIDAVPRLVSAATEAVRAFAESLEAMPAGESAELVSHAYGRVDGSEVGQAVNALSRLVIRLHEENPELFPSSRTGLMSDVMETADFGKLRKALTYHLGERLEYLRGEVGLLGENPVALVNLFSVVAPLVNDALRVLKSVTDILALPAEAMTYALFKILQDIDWREFAAAVNGVAAIVVTLHRGSYIIGDGSLYTRNPFAHISSELLAGLDGRLLAEALGGIGEEGEAFLGAFAGQVLNDASMVVPLAEAVVSLANSAFRAAADVLEKASSLPSETVGAVSRALVEGLETAELARALRALAATGRRLAAEDPGLMRKLSREALAGLDLGLSPGTAAAGVNRALAFYNSWSYQNPGLVAENLDNFFAGIGTRELEKAVTSTSAQVAEALSRHPAVMKTFVKAVFSLVFESARGYVKGLRSRGKGRRK